MTKKHGLIVVWQEEKGFGFIEPVEGGKQVFFHIKSWESIAVKPQSHLHVKYDLSKDHKNRICAVNVSVVPALIDGLSFKAQVTRLLPEKSVALLSHVDYPKTPFVVLFSALNGVLPQIGQTLSGRLKLHKSGHWLLEPGTDNRSLSLVSEDSNIKGVDSANQAATVKPKATSSRHPQRPVNQAGASKSKSQVSASASSWRDGEVARGVLQDWNDEKGYGFLQTNDGKPKVFFHISHYLELDGRPKTGMTMEFKVQKQDGQQWQATQVQCMAQAPKSSSNRQKRSQTPTISSNRVVMATVLALGWLAVLWMMAPVLAGWCLLVSVVSFTSYRADKQAALKDKWRVSENRLHLQDLLGGWPGGWVARLLWRHKVSKQSFVVTFWLTVLVNVIALTWLARNVAQYLPTL